MPAGLLKFDIQAHYLVLPTILSLELYRKVKDSFIVENSVTEHAKGSASATKEKGDQ